MLPRNEALRFVAGARPGSLLVDVRRRLPGRGVSVHPQRRCLEAALRRGGLSRGLRRPVSVTPEALFEAVAMAYREWVDGLLVAARGAGCVEVGTDAVRHAIREGRAVLVLVASDAANRRREVERMAAERGLPCLLHGEKRRLGALWGRDVVGLAALTDSRFGDRVLWGVRQSDAFAGSGSSGEGRVRCGPIPGRAEPRKDHGDGSVAASRSEGS